MLAKLIYIVQSIQFEIFTHIFTRDNDDYEVLKLQHLQGPFTSKFQNFQGPVLFSSTFQVLEKWIIFFQGLSRKRGHPVTYARVCGKMMSAHTHTLHINRHYPGKPGFYKPSLDHA